MPKRPWILFEQVFLLRRIHRDQIHPGVAHGAAFDDAWKGEHLSLMMEGGETQVAKYFLCIVTNARPTQSRQK